MKKSTHRVEIVDLDPVKHPNADALSIQKVYGYQVVLRTEDWAGKTLGAYIVPDTVVDTQRKEFSWLAPENNPRFSPANGSEDKRYHRITAMKLRGVISHGLMVEAPEGFKVGDDASDFLETARYQPTLNCEFETFPPERYTKEYDLEAFERYSEDIFKPGERVAFVEKLDGMNARFCFDGERMHAGTKTVWVDPEKGANSSVWKVLKRYPQLEKLCRENPSFTVYGEIVGWTPEHGTKLRYGTKQGEVDFYIFDILDKDEYLGLTAIYELTEKYHLKQAPVLSYDDYDFERAKAAAPGKTLVAGVDHIREGIIVRSYKERRELMGRAILKLVAW